MLAEIRHSINRQWWLVGSRSPLIDFFLCGEGECGCPPPPHPLTRLSVEKDRLQDIYRVKTQTVRSTCTGGLMSLYLQSAQSHSCRKVHIYFKLKCLLFRPDQFLLLVFYYCFFFVCLIFFSSQEKVQAGQYSHCNLILTRHRDPHRYR